MILRRQLVFRAFVSLLAVPESSKMAPSTLPMDFVSQQAMPTTAAVRQYHEPPPGIDYSKNPSIFGKILRGELPAIVFDESPSVLAFQDRTPRAQCHALVIPKRFIPTVASLTKDDLTILQEMHEMGLGLIEQHQPEAFARKDYILCFHLPPFNSVNHLHLHVLVPASKMNCLHRFGKYQVGTPWCADEANVRHRLMAGKKPM